MLTIADPKRYAAHRSARAQGTASARFMRELGLPAALFGCIGAIAWAVRGTSGWNGIDGTVVPGMMWAILWWYLCTRKGIRANSTALWLGLGITGGGELGYGIYVSWIRGIFMFDANQEIIPVDPSLGWLGFFICGIGWAAPSGICLGWALSTKRSLLIWLPRILIPYLAYHGSALLVSHYPEYFFPNYTTLDYTDESISTFGSVIWTQTLKIKVLCAWIASMGVALAQRDKTSFTINGIIGIGFGFGFMLSALWCLGYGSDTYASLFDWWKLWELNAGLYLGILYALALWWSIRDLDTRYDPQGTPLSNDDFTEPAGEWNIRTLCEMVGVVILTMTIFYEDSFRTSVAMSALFVAATALLIMQALNGLTPQKRDESRARIAQTFCVFLFLFVTWHGLTSTLGTLIGTHSAKMVDQYSWPIERQWLFAPLGLLIFAGSALHMARILRSTHHQDTPPQLSTCLSDHMINLMLFLAAAGAISIWPSKIGSFYAFFIWGAILAFIKLNRRLDHIDQQEFKQ
jgi:hypothetical protein